MLQPAHSRRRAPSPLAGPFLPLRREKAAGEAALLSDEWSEEKSIGWYAFENNGSIILRQEQYRHRQDLGHYRPSRSESSGFEAGVPD